MLKLKILAIELDTWNILELELELCWELKICILAIELDMQNLGQKQAATYELILTQMGPENFFIVPSFYIDKKPDSNT